MSRKKLTEDSFAYLNRSGLRGPAESRELIETWLSHVPVSEHRDFYMRFRSGKESEFTSALQEITLHELLRCLRCKVCFHPNVPSAATQPDFEVQQPKGPKFILEARTSTEIESGPDGGTRAYEVREFLHSLDLQGYLISIDELKEGSGTLSQKSLRRHIDDGIKSAAADCLKGRISIPLFATSDGWRIKPTAYALSRYGPRRYTVMQEAWGRTWAGPSYPLRVALEKKASRYGQLAMPYVIAINSSDVMLTHRDFQDTLFGPAPMWHLAAAQTTAFGGQPQKPPTIPVSARSCSPTTCARRRSLWIRSTPAFI
jgi:hypothetical protein